jgi:prepilin-type N-terminal cleavage/methylation domain-containing protein
MVRKLVKAVHNIYSGKAAERGFTLIELLVVIGILGALAGVVTLAVGRFIGAGKSQAHLTDQHNVQTAIVAYMAEDPAGAPPTSGSMSALSPYLVDDPLCQYTWDNSTGTILTQTNCSH